MIGLTVYLNKKKLAVAGADDLCVLNAIVNAVGELGKSTTRVGKRRTVDLWLSVGGLTRRPKGTEDEHLRWVGHKRLRIGDRITVQSSEPTDRTSIVALRLRQAIKKRPEKSCNEQSTARQNANP